MPIAALSGSGRLAGPDQLQNLPEVKTTEPSLAARACREQQPCHGDGATAVPLLYQDQVLGVVWVEDVEGIDAQEQHHALWRLGREAVLVMWAAQVKEKLDSGTLQVEELLNLQ